VQRIEDKSGQLKVDSLADWKPMELPKDWSDVITPLGSSQQSRGSVLNSLKPLHQAVGDTVHDRITVVQADYETNAWTIVLVASADNERTTGRS